MANVKILLVDDDVALRQTVTEWLLFQGYEVDTCSDGESALEKLPSQKYDLLILDWSMPKKTGIEVCAQFRSLGGNSPVLMLTAMKSVDNKEAGFEAGADDYLTKPFAMKELSARIRALLRRPESFTGDLLSVNNITLNRRAKEVKKAGKDIALSKREFALLEWLMLHPDTVFTCEDLLDHVWASSSDATPMAVRKQIKELRRKLDDGDGTSVIKNIPGAGYKLLP